MGIIDIFLMAVIFFGSLYLLYHSIWKKRGHCVGSGCTSCHSGKADACDSGNGSVEPGER